MIWIKKFWRGEIPLAKAFWFYGVFIFLVICVALRLVAPMLLLPFGLVVGLGGGNLVIALLIAAMALLPQIIYQVLASVGIWRSSEAYLGPALRAFLCRLVLALAAAVTVSDAIVTVIEVTPALRQQFLLSGTGGIFGSRGK